MNKFGYFLPRKDPHGLETQLVPLVRCPLYPSDFGSPQLYWHQPPSCKTWDSFQPASGSPPRILIKASFPGLFFVPHAAHSRSVLFHPPNSFSTEQPSVCSDTTTLPKSLLMSSSLIRSFLTSCQEEKKKKSP